MLFIIHGQLAVYDYIMKAFGIGMWFIKCGDILYFVFIEDHDIRCEAGLQ